MAACQTTRLAGDSSAWHGRPRAGPRRPGTVVVRRRLLPVGDAEDERLGAGAADRDHQLSITLKQPSIAICTVPHSHGWMVTTELKLSFSLPGVKWDLQQGREAP